MNKKSYFLEIQQIIASLPDDKKQVYINAFIEREKNPVASFGFNVFLGFLGADRFYVGDTLLGFLKLITGGGFGIWILIDYFLIAGTTRDKNIQAARELRGSLLPG